MNDVGKNEQQVVPYVAPNTKRDDDEDDDTDIEISDIKLILLIILVSVLVAVIVFIGIKIYSAIRKGAKKELQQSLEMN